MWFQALDDIATRTHWKLIVIAKFACSIDLLPVNDPDSPERAWTACERWRKLAAARIRHLDPDVLVISQSSPAEQVATILGGRSYPHDVWQSGLEAAIADFRISPKKVVVIGNIPLAGGPKCLARHSGDVQFCSGTLPQPITPYNDAERAAVAAVGGTYVDVTPWFCGTVCPVVIGQYAVYWDHFHVSRTYSQTLETVLEQSLPLGSART